MWSKIKKFIIPVLYILMFLTGCGIQQQKPKIQITHVLAVTQEGDTLKLPIDVVRPINYRIINYNSGYGWNSWYRPYHNTYYNYNYSSSVSPRGSTSNNASSSSTYGQTARPSNNNPKSVPSTDSNSSSVKQPRR